VDEINKILTEYTYMSAYERREGRDEQMKRFEESYEVIEQVDVPVDIGRFLRCAVSNDAFSIAEYLIHRDRNCVRLRDVLGRSRRWCTPPLSLRKKCSSFFLPN
jgi:hypothetical protein